MQFLKSRKSEGSSEGPSTDALAVLDGTDAILSMEHDGGSTAALSESGCAAVTRASTLWSQAANGDGPALGFVKETDDGSALAAAAGLAESGLRATAWVSGVGLLNHVGLLHAIAGKHLPLVVHAFDQAAPQTGWSDLPGHAGYHAASGAGWFELMAWDSQSAADLTLIARRLTEQALVPGLLAQESWLTSHRATPLQLPNPAWVARFMGAASDAVPCPTPAQQLLYGAERPRVPPLWQVDNPLLTGAVHGVGSYAEVIAGMEPYWYAPLPELARQIMADYAKQTGRTYAPVIPYRCEDAHLVMVVQGSAVRTAMALADYMRQHERIRVGVLNLCMLRPFPGAAVATILQGRRSVLVMERALPDLASDPPLLSEIRACLHRGLENGQAPRDESPHAGYPRIRRADTIPPLLGVSYGLGGNAVDKGALADLLKDAAGAKSLHRVVLGVEYVPQKSHSPKHELAAQRWADAFPHLATLQRPAIHPIDLHPSGTLTVRVFAGHGGNPFTSATNPGPILQTLSSLHVQGWPTVGNSRRGSLSTYSLVIAREPIVALQDPTAVDLAIAVDTTGLHNPALVNALKPGSSLLVVTDDSNPAAEQLSPELRSAVRSLDVNVYSLPGHRLAASGTREGEARRQRLGQILQGALLAWPPMAGLTGLHGAALLRELKSTLLARAPGADAAELEAGLEPLQAGIEGLRASVPASMPEDTTPDSKAARDPVSTAPLLPAAPELRTLPERLVPVHDLHAHWEAHPWFRGKDGITARTADPLVGAGLLPAATGLLRNFGENRNGYPHWLPEPCTGCGACWSVCPDAALPGLVNTPGELLVAGTALLEARGVDTALLPRAVRTLESKWRARLRSGGNSLSVGAALRTAIADASTAVKVLPEEQAPLDAALQALGTLLESYPLAVTATFFSEPEAAGSTGGLLSVTVDPDHCKACQACVEACPESALEWRAQSDAALTDLRERWFIWHALPSSGEAYSRLGESRTEPPLLETLLLDKGAYRALLGGNDGDPGSSDNTTLHLFAAAAEAALRPRMTKHGAYLTELIERLQAHLRQRLAVDVSNGDALQQTLRAAQQQDLTLADLSQRVDRDRTPIDTAWLARVTETLAGLQQLRDAYLAAGSSAPRASLGMVIAVDEDTAPLASYPFNPATFPVSGQSASTAAAAWMGVVEGHLAQMAQDFRLVRMAELELEDHYNPEIHDPFFRQFNRNDFNADEWELCPPVVLAGTDAALSGKYGGAVLALLHTGLPVKVLCLDAESHRSLAHKPGTLPPFGEAPPGTGDANTVPSARTPSLPIMAMLQGDAFVEQGGLADIPRLLQGFLQGLSTPRPAVFSVYRSELPQHGGADALSVWQSRLALLGRAHPALRYDPDAGEALHQRLTLVGNPLPESAWPTATLEHVAADGHADAQEVSFTFAHFALAVPALAHHFRLLPPDTSDDAVAPLEDYLTLDAEERREVQPYIEAVDATGRLGRWTLSAALVQATADRTAIWGLLRTLTREDIVPVDEAAIAEDARSEVVEAVWRNLMELAQGDSTQVADELTRLAQQTGSGSDGGAGHA